MYLRGRIKLDIACAEVCHFLYSGSCVVKEEHQGSITQRGLLVDRQCSERAVDLIALEKDGFGKRSALSLNSDYSLCLPKPLRVPLANVFEKRTDRS
jgi:hypothetical protein